MNLNFLGRGAAFNTKEGNNSAYFISNNEIFIIDSGETTFEKLIERNLLSKIKKINLLITHTHSDHIGSIGSLVMYSYYILKKKVNIVMPHTREYLKVIKNILGNFGCTNLMYDFVDENNYDNKYDLFNSVRFIKTKHVDNLVCYGIIFKTESGVVYFSGDTSETRIIKNIIKKKEKIDKIYIDTTSLNYEGNVHLYIGKLKDIIPNNLKEHVYCMHVNNDDCIKKALNYGFNVVDIKL